MMASMGPGFGHPNAMQQHPGVPGGHPMGPGMPHNPSQQGVPGGGIPPQLSHMGVSGAPVNQALMGTMPPTAGGPNAHALQHLNPGQAQMFQQQQLHGAMQAPFHQQHYLQQQQQARQAIMAQQQHGNMGVMNGIPMSMAGMNPAQIAAMRRMGPGQNPQAQALMAQRMAMQQHQQAQAQNQHMIPGNTPGQSMQMTPQQLQTLQNQQAQIAAATMQAQASGQGQPHQGQRPHPQVQQQQQPGQHTPQSSQAQIQVGTPAPSGGQQTPGQTPGPTPGPQAQQQQQAQQQAQQAQQQQQAQQHQAQQQQQAQQQHQAQQQQLAQQQQQLAQQQQQQQQQQPQGQQQQVTQAQLQMQHAAQMNAAAAQQLAMSQNLGHLAPHRGPGGDMKSNCLLKLMLFSEHLSGYPGSKGKGDLTYWNEFVRIFFSPRGVFRHSVHINEVEQETDKQYEIAFPALARYFHTYFESGVKTMQFVMDKGTTDRTLPNGCVSIENSRSSFVYWFENGLHLVATGSMRAQFDENCKLDVLEFSTTGHEEFVPLKSVIKAAMPSHNWVKEWHKMNTQDAKSSPEMSKKSKAKQMKSPQNAPPDALVDLPGSAVKESMGIPEAVFQFLETAEVMGQMIPLFGYCHSHPGVSARTALEQYVVQQQQSMNAQQQQQAMAQGPRPGGPPGPQNFNMPMGASPSMVQMQLPGSPHVMGSPAPGHMQAPGMAMQKSHQGTSSSGPSANTSPASNKRRRPSGVKAEEDGVGTPGGQVNGVQGKKPPTPRMPKKAKTSQ